MTVVVTSLNSGRITRFEGTARQIEAALRKRYSFLHRAPEGDLWTLIDMIRRQQNYAVDINPAENT